MDASAVQCTSNFTLSALVHRQCVAEDARGLLRDADSDEIASHYSALSEDEAASPQLREAFRCLALAEEQCQDDEAEAAAKSAQDAMSIFAKESQPLHEMEAMRMLLRSYNLRGKPEMAMQEAQTKLSSCRERSDKAGEATMLLSSAECHLCMYKPKEALQQFKEAADIFASLSNKRMQVKALIEVCCAQLASYMKTEAVETAKQATGIAKESGDKSLEAQALLMHAQALLDAEAATDLAMTSARQSSKLAKEAKKPRLEAAALDFIAVLYIRGEQAKKALRIAMQALELCEESGHKRGHAAAVTTAVFTLLDLGDFNRANEEASRALSVFQQAGYKRGEAAIRQAFAYIFAERHDMEPAVRESDLEVSIYETLDDKLSKGKALVLQAGLHYYNRDGNSCKNSAQIASEIFQELNDVKWQGIARYVEIFAHLLDDNLQEAADAAADSLRTFTKVQDKQFQAYALFGASAAHLSRGEFSDAIEQSSRAQELFRDIKDSRSEAIALIVASDTQRQIGAYADAIALAEEGAGLCLRTAFKRGQAACLQRQALAHLERTEFEKASELLSEARRLYQLVQDRQSETSILSFISLVNLEMATLSSNSLSEVPDKMSSAGKRFKKELARTSREAKSKAVSGVALAKWMGDKAQEGLAMLYLAQAHAAYGSFREGYDTGMAAAQLFEDVSDQPAQVHALVAAAEILNMDQSKKRDVPVIEGAANMALDMAVAIGDQESADRARRVLDDCKVKVVVTEDVAPGADGADVALGALPTGAASAPVQAKSSLEPAYVTEVVHKAVMEAIADEEDVYLDSPLMESGMDSLSSVAFRNGLASALSLSLPAALMFDYPSQRAIVEHVLEITAS